jgi:hypothetical protein
VVRIHDHQLLINIRRSGRFIVGLQLIEDYGQIRRILLGEFGIEACNGMYLDIEMLTYMTS